MLVTQMFPHILLVLPLFSHHPAHGPSTRTRR
jgi:hypothetical protein